MTLDRLGTFGFRLSFYKHSMSVAFGKQPLFDKHYVSRILDT